MLDSGDQEKGILGELDEWSSNLTVIPDKAVVEVGKSQEVLYLFPRGGGRPFGDNTYLNSICLHLPSHVFAFIYN